MMFRLKQILLLLVPTLLLIACDQPQNAHGENSSQATAIQNDDQFRISGVASKGPIRAATINIFAMDTNGIKTGTPLATTTTDNTGFWSTTITPAPTGVLLVESSGGSYVDEADPEPIPVNKRTITLAPSDIIEGVLFPGNTTASITLLTDALLEKSRQESASTDIQTVLFNNRNNAISALGFDPFGIAATDPISPSASASNDSVKYAMYLGGVATALNSAAIILGKPVADYAMMMAMVQDLSDGRLNGQDGSGVVTLLVDSVQQNFPDTLNLNQSILRFRNNNFQAYEATSVSEPVSVNETALAQPGTNTFPIANDDIATTAVDTSITISSALGNDSDADGDSLTVTLITQPANGSVSSPSNGVFVYAPTTGFSGSDAFTYTVDDGRGGSASASVIINVQQTVSNLAPVAFAGNNFSVLEQTAVNVNGSGQDADGTVDLFSWAQESGPAVTLNSTNTAITGFTAPDVTSIQTVVLSLTVTDNQGLTGTSSVSITINPISVPPVANAGADLPADELTSVTLTGSATADTGRTISTFSWSQVSGVTVNLINANTATPNFSTPEVLLGNIEVLVFQLTATDDVGSSGFDFVTSVVNPVLIPPTANAGVDQTVNEQVQVTLNGSGADDRNISSFSWVQVPGAGSPTVTLSDPNIANPTFNAPDVANDTTLTFQLTVTDDENGAATDTVNITLISANVGPTLADDPSITTPEDTPVVITTLRDNDIDPENNTPITINSVTQPANGTVVIEANNLDVTYIPSANFNGTDTFTYTALDSLLANSTNSATVTVTVSGVNDNPVANADTGSVVQGFPLTISNLTANDTDPENDPLSITGVTQPANGVSVNNGDGTVTYTPDLAFNGIDSFTYSIVDGTGGSASGTVTITVIADSDGDGETDTQEGIDGTNPNLADSDGDGFFDGHEKLVGTNPNLNTQFPPNPLASSIISSANTNNVISTDTTWSLAQSPFLVQSDVTIQSGATLTIEPGVVVKLVNNVDIFVSAGGVLNAIGNAPVPQHVIFTSDHDDTINGDTNNDGGATTASGGDWGGIDLNLNSDGTIQFSTVKNAVNCISINNSSPVIDSVDVGDCSGFGINVFSSSSSTRSTNLSSINIIDFNGNGTSTNTHGIQITSSSAATTVLNLSNITITEAGDSTFENGIDILANSGHFSGTIDNVSVINPSGDGINIRNTSTGDVNIALSNMTVNGSPTNSLDVRDTFITSGILNLAIDGINSFTNNATTSTAIYFENNNPDFLATSNSSVNTAGYGLQLNNSTGSFRNITMDNTTIAGMRLQNASAPLVFSNIVLTNADTPYELVGQNLTPTIIAGYDFTDPSVSKNYIRVLGTFPADMTLTPDPLNTGGAGAASVWRVPGDITVPAGVTLTINDGAIVKFDLSRIVFVNGSLVIGDGDGLGTQAILTSSRDESVGADADTADTTLPAAGNWNYLQINNGSTINIDNAIIRYMNRGIFQSFTDVVGFTITNSEFREFNTYGMDITTTGNDTFIIDTVTVANQNASTNSQDGIRIANSGTRTITVDFDNVTVDTVGNDVGNDRGIEFFLDNNSLLTGRFDNVTVRNTFGTGILIQNTTGGLVNPVFSGLTITNPGSNRYGLQLIGNSDGFTQPTLDASTGINLIGDASPGSGGFYGMLVQGVNGSYSNITISNTTSSALFMSGTTNPLLWDDASIILNTSPSPWTIRTTFPASIGVLGTADLGYTTGTGLIQNYVQLNSTLVDTVVVADPLNTGGAGPASVWRVDSDVTIPAGVTLTINDGAIVKFDLNRIVFVNGNLVVGDGIAGGAQAILTSTRDETVGADADPTDTTAPAAGNWNYLQLNAGSSINMDNAIVRYMNRGIYHPSTAISSFSVSNSEIREFNTYGMDLTTASNISYTLNNVTVANQNTSTNNSDGIRIANSGTRTITLDFDNVTIDTVGNDVTNDRGLEIFLNSNSLLTGRIDNLTVNNTFGTAVILQNTTAGLVNPVFSGLNISNPGSSRYGLQLIGNSDGFTQPTVDNSCPPENPTCAPPTNFIGDPLVADTGGVYGMLVQGVNGVFNNITISNTVSTTPVNNPKSSALFISGVTNPTIWDDASIVINNSPSPWTIRTSFPASIGVLGTTDLGYTAGTGLIQNYVQMNSTISDMTLVPDPLNTGGAGPVSVWRVDTDVTIPAGVTLTINDGAIVKFDLSRIVNINGNLVVGDGDGLGANAILTSIRDESVGADTDPADTTAPAAGNWNYLQLNTGSSINMDNAIVRYMNRGIYHPSTAITSFSVSNTQIREFNTYGMDLTTAGNLTYIVDTVTVANQNPSTNNSDGIRIANSGTRTITLDFDNVTIDTVGDDATNDRGLEIFLTSNSLLTGRVDNLTVSNTFGTGVILQNSSSGLVDPIFSGLNIFDVGVHGMQLLGLGAGNTLPVINASVGTNIIGNALTAGSGGDLGLTFQGVNGTYSDITVHSTNLSALYFSNNANPTFGLNITLDNSPAPYSLVGMALPAGVAYTSGAGLVENYVRIFGDLLTDLTLSPEPLGAGSGSFWRVPGNFRVPAARTLTLSAGVVMKFDAGFQFDVQSGGTLNVNGTAGNHVVMTSSTDNNIGTGNTALLIDWEGVNFNAGSGGTINFLDIWYARDGIDLVNVTSNPVFTNLSVNYCQDGLRINSSTGMSLTFNNLALSENSSNHMVLEGNGSLSTTFTESTVNGLSITDIPGNGADATNGIFISNTDVNNIVSGFTIDGTSNPIRYASSGSNITDNNIIRNSTGVGINHTSNGNPLIRNNIIVNSASSGMSISGNGNIFGNLIRQNRRHSGGGIFISGSNATIENNLIIENESTSNTSNSGGSGIYVTGNSSPTIINNTIANNFSADNGGFEGAGINVESSGGTVTLRDNIIFGNTDNTGANDIYDDVGRITVSGTNLIGTINSNAGLNLYTGVGDVAANDPLFVQGWYLSSNNEGPISPAVDAGSNNASAILPLPLNTLTSRTDGGLDGIADGAIVNVGYHYAGAFVAANAVNSTATSNPASPVITVAATPVVITITPRDGASNVIGPGLEVHAIVASNVANPSTGTQGTTGTNSTMTSVRDLGDGSYEVTFTPDSGSANSENISFSVNGVTLNATVSVTWTL